MAQDTSLVLSLPNQPENEEVTGVQRMVGKEKEGGNKMKVSEWLEQQGLTVDSEMPDLIMASTLKVPEEIMDGLSDEDKTNARNIARVSGDMEFVNTYISWLKAGDVAMFNTGSTASEALERIIKDFGGIYFCEKAVPVKPFEHFSFRNSSVSYVVAMRFVKVE